MENGFNRFLILPCSLWFPYNEAITIAWGITKHNKIWVAPDGCIIGQTLSIYFMSYNMYSIFLYLSSLDVTFWLKQPNFSKTDQFDLREDKMLALAE